ncbi:hypothetical protein [Bacillus sp. FJAT-29814]|uniref:hypothetical protein n=1 Tax=Bacillus sp. FJAT-29814 TaxID=1729688 RepID=UPI0020A40E8C|nr:hypothetical protein [Bacillus sp. FJAT-29814]
MAQRVGSQSRIQAGQLQQTCHSVFHGLNENRVAWLFLVLGENKSFVKIGLTTVLLHFLLRNHMLPKCGNHLFIHHDGSFGFGFYHKRMVSGAGHDAQFIASYVLKAMLFVQMPLAS